MKKKNATVSLIITTYNWKEALKESILSALNQSILPDEIIIADDGSKQDTEEMIIQINKNSSLPIIHVWQEDLGFRVATIRNKAIARAKCEYIIVADGDILFHPHFVEDHLNFAKEGFFNLGPRVILSEKLSTEINFQIIRKINFFTNGIRNRKNSIHSEILAKLLSYESTVLTNIRSCNLAFWKADALKINGFNEEFEGYGREDLEFAARLKNNGIKRFNIRYSAIGYHIYHKDNKRDSVAFNDIMVAETIEKKLKWCLNGINKYLHT